MKKHSEDNPDWNSQRMKIIGLGESSIRKSYYPELQQRLDELLRKNEDLNAAYEELTATQEELRQNYDELARRERELVESKNLLEAIYNGSPDMIYIHAADGRILDVNENVTMNLGFTREEMQRTVPEDVSGKDYTTSMAMEQMNKALSGASPEFEWIAKRKNDGELPVEVRLRRLELVNDRGEKEYRILAIVRDLTRSKQAEKALRESEEKFRNITEYVPLGMHIYQLKPDGRLVFLGANPAADTILKLDHSRMMGKTIEEAFPLLNETQIPEKYRNVAATGENWQSDETLYYDGTVQGAFSVYAFRISTGTMVAMFRDITETRRAAISLEQARKKMNLLNSVTFQDIQSAAFSLTAYHVLIDQINPDKKISAYLEKEKVLIQKIVTSLNFAKDYQDMGMHSPRWQTVSQTFLFAISHLDFSKITHNLEVANLEIYADPLLEKVFFNLMENVLRHGDTARRVRLYCQEKTDELVLFIEDNGIGIPQEEKQMIFDRGHGKDTGLGLFLVREILSITGMSVRETGMYGQGTRFEIHIPKGAYRFNPPA
jgi:PAS domain S-box-containing protein